MKLPRFKSPFKSLPSDWNVPSWNLPSAQEFLDAREIIAVLHAELLLCEKKIEEQERIVVSKESGENCEPTKARLAKARFEAQEWQRLWREFIDATQNTATGNAVAG